MIIGQDKLIRFIDKQTLSTLPRTIMLEGQPGSGRHLLCQYISEKFNLKIEDISDNLTYELIENINLRVEPYLYIIDSSKITVKNENAILKFLEEPLKNAFIVILTENQYNQIETIRNRCYLLTMSVYNTDTLKQFINNEKDMDFILMICKTPGDVIKLQSHPLENIITLCEKILNKINIASFANMLTLSNNIAFKNEKDKYDFLIFFRVLLYVAKVQVINQYPKCIQTYNLTNEFYNRTKIRNVDMKMLFENYLFELKRLKSQQ